MDPLEIGALMVRLKGDPSKFNEMLEGAKKSAKETASSIKATASDIKDFQKTLESADDTLAKQASKIYDKATSGPLGMLGLVQDAAKAAKGLDEAMAVITKSTGASSASKSEEEDFGFSDDDVAAIKENAEEVVSEAEDAAEEVTSAYAKMAERIKKYLPFSDEELKQIADYWNGVKAIIVTVAKFVGEVLVGITKTALAAVETLRKNWESIKGAIVSAWQAAYEAVQPILQSIRERAQTLMDGVAEFWREKMMPITGVLFGLVVGIKVAISLAATAISELASWASAAADGASMAGRLVGSVWKTTTQYLRMAWDAMSDLVGMIGTSIGVITGLAIALGTLYGAYRLILVVVRLLRLEIIAVAVAKRLAAAASLAWAAAMALLTGFMKVYAGVMIAAKGVAIALNAVMNIGALFTAAWQAVVTAFTAAWAALVSVVQGVISAIASLNVVLLAMQAAAVAVAILAIVVAFEGVTAVVKSLHGAVSNLYKVFADKSAYTGLILIQSELKAIVDLWGRSFSGLFRALRLDAKLAWELVTAMARLAVEQIKTYWTPVFNLVIAGFGAAWKAVADGFIVNMGPALVKVLNAVGNIIYYIPGSKTKAAGEKLWSQARNLEDEAFQKKDNPTARAEKALSDAITKFSLDFKKASKGSALKEAGDAVEELLKKIAALKDPVEEANKAAGKSGEEAGQRIAAAYREAKAAVYGTVEAMARVQEYVQEAIFTVPNTPENRGKGGTTDTAGSDKPKVTSNRRNIRDLQDLAGWRSQMLEAIKLVQTNTKQTADNTAKQPAVAGAP